MGGKKDVVNSGATRLKTALLSKGNFGPNCVPFWNQTKQFHSSVIAAFWSLIRPVGCQMLVKGLQWILWDHVLFFFLPIYCFLLRWVKQCNDLYGEQTGGRWFLYALLHGNCSGAAKRDTEEMLGKGRHRNEVLAIIFNHITAWRVKKALTWSASKPERRPLRKRNNEEHCSGLKKIFCSMLGWVFPRRVKWGSPLSSEWWSVRKWTYSPSPQRTGDSKQIKMIGRRFWEISSRLPHEMEASPLLRSSVTSWMVIRVWFACFAWMCWRFACSKS